MSELLSLVIPAYDEERRIPGSLRAVRACLEGLGLRYEVIVVDDGSRDGTAAVVEDLIGGWPELRLIRLSTNRGKGAAVRAGLLDSRGSLIAFADADLSAPIEQLGALLEDLRDAEVALVSRGLPGARLGRRQSWLRETLGKMYGVLQATVLLDGIPDTQCGLKAFRGDLGREIFECVAEPGGLFDTEALVVAVQKHARISQRPGYWSHDPETRLPMTLGRAFDIFAELARIKRRRGVLTRVRAHGPIHSDVR